jgi:hypothetical protein
MQTLKALDWTFDKMLSESKKDEIIQMQKEKMVREA